MSERQFLYMIGYPGAGKSSLLAATLRGVSVRPTAIMVQQVSSHPERKQIHEHRALPYLIYPRGIQIGGARAEFPGTDALAMNIQPAVLTFLSQSNYRYVVAEGDRLGNGKFFAALVAAGWALTVCWLNVTPEVAALRRSARGSDQNPIWLKGRQTKVDKLGREWADASWILNGALPVEYLAEQLRRHPVIAGLRG